MKYPFNSITKVIIIAKWAGDYFFPTLMELGKNILIYFLMEWWRTHSNRMA